MALSSAHMPSVHTGYITSYSPGHCLCGRPCQACLRRGIHNVCMTACKLVQLQGALFSHEYINGSEHGVSVTYLYGQARSGRATTVDPKRPLYVLTATVQAHNHLFKRDGRCASSHRPSIQLSSADKLPVDALLHWMSFHVRRLRR